MVIIEYNILCDAYDIHDSTGVNYIEYFNLLHDILYPYTCVKKYKLSLLRYSIWLYK